MAESGPVAEAFVQVRADLSKLSPEIRNGVAKSFESVDHAAKSSGNEISRSLGGGAEKASREVRASMERVGGAFEKPRAGSEKFGKANTGTAKTLGKLGDAAKEAGGKAEKAESGFDGIAGMGKKLLVTGGALYAFTKLRESIKGFVEAGQEASARERVTAALIATTGGAAHVTAGHIDELTSTLAANTGISKTTVNAADNILLSFRNVANQAGKNNDIFDQTTKAAADLSTVMGGDLSGATAALGKALNAPADGLSRLQREGIVFTAQQKQQVKDMVAAGNTLGAQKIILGEVQKEFGGAANAAADPIKKLKAATDQLKESIGSGLVAGLGPAIAPIQAVFVKLQAPLSQLGKLVGTTLGTLVSAIAPILSALGPVFQNLGGLVASLAKPLALVGGLIGGVIGTVLPPFIHLLANLATNIAPVVQALAEALLPVIAKIGPYFAKLGPVIGKVAFVLSGALVTVIEHLAPILPALANAFIAIALAGDRILVALLPLVPVITQFAVLLIDKIGAPALIGIANAVAAVATALADLLVPLTKNRVVMDILKVVVVAVAAAFVEMKVVEGLGVIVQALGFAFGFLNAALDANPIVLIVGALVLLGIGIVEAYQHIKPFRDAVDAVGRFLRDKVLPVLKEVGSFLKKEFVAAWHAIVPIIKAVLPVVKSVGTFFLNYFLLPIRTVIKIVTDLFQGHFTAAFHVLLDLPKKILALFGDLPSKLGAILGHLATIVGHAVVDAGKWLLKAGGDILKGLLAGLTTGLPFLAGFMLGLPIRLARYGEHAVTWLAKAGLHVIEGFVKAEIRGLPIVAKFLLSLPGKIAGWTASAIKWLNKAGLAVIKGLWNGLTTALPIIGRFLLALPGRISGWVSGAAHWLLSTGAHIINGLHDGLVRTVGAVFSFFSGLPGKIVRAIGDLGNRFFDIGTGIMTSIWKGLMDGLGTLLHAAEHIGSSLWSGIKHGAGLHSPSPLFIAIGRDVVGSVIMGMDASHVRLAEATQRLARVALIKPLKVGLSAPNVTGAAGAFTAAAAQRRGPGGNIVVTLAPGAIVIHVGGSDTKAGTAAGRAAAESFAATLAERRVLFAAQAK